MSRTKVFLQNSLVEALWG